MILFPYVIPLLIGISLLVMLTAIVFDENTSALIAALGSTLAVSGLVLLIVMIPQARVRYPKIEKWVM